MRRWPNSRTASNYPNQQLGVLQSALGMTPYEQGQQGSSTDPDADGGQSRGDGARRPADAGRPVLGPGWRNERGVGHRQSVRRLSDRSMKTDITKVGTHPSGIAIHAYRYKGDPKSYPKVVGPMAEDVAKTFGPGSVAKIPGSGGKMAVHPAIMGALALLEADRRWARRFRLPRWVGRAA